jgi:hypothetical protein
LISIPFDGIWMIQCFPSGIVVTAGAAVTSADSGIVAAVVAATFLSGAVLARVVALPTPVPLVAGAVIVAGTLAGLFGGGAGSSELPHPATIPNPNATAAIFNR